MMIGLLVGGGTHTALRVHSVGEGNGELVWAKSGGREKARGRIRRATLVLMLARRKMGRVWANKERGGGFCGGGFLLLIWWF